MRTGPVSLRLMPGQPTLAATLVLLLLAAGCVASASPATPTTPPATPTPTSSPAMATASPAESSVVKLKDVKEFDDLRSQGQPTLLAVLDQAYT